MTKSAATASPASSAENHQAGEQQAAHLPDFERARGRLLEHSDRGAAGVRQSRRHKTDFTPRPPNAWVSGMICARGAAAMVTEILSLAMSVGSLHPTTASFAVHGVMRSICARTMPSRNSDARRGNSSGAEEELLGPHRQFDLAAFQHRRRFARTTGDAVGNLDRREDGDDLPAGAWMRECSIRLLGEPNDTRRRQPAEHRRRCRGDAVHPARKTVGDLAQEFHRIPLCDP